MLSSTEEIAAFNRGTLQQRLRSTARSAALDVLSAGYRVSGQLRESLRRPRVHILYLHHILRDEEASVRALLRELQREHTFISYSAAVEHIRRGDFDRPYVAFTFDDGLRNSLRAAELLEEFGASACFFVCTAMAEPRSDADVARFCADELHLPPAEFLRWEDMETLLRRGHEIGNHSARHKTLATLTATELEEDIAVAAEKLRARLGEVKHFAWPRGRFAHMSADAVATVFRSGHETCASAERGSHVAPAPDAQALCIRRDHVGPAQPPRHTLAFMARSASRANAANNDWPASWRPRIEAAR
jgi:peptidoglycan/xylan/chitin deacetylase (PgdA/CDA1 family)